MSLMSWAGSSLQGPTLTTGISLLDINDLTWASHPSTITRLHYRPPCLIILALNYMIIWLSLHCIITHAQTVPRVEIDLCLISISYETFLFQPCSPTLLFTRSRFSENLISVVLNHFRLLQQQVLSYSLELHVVPLLERLDRISIKQLLIISESRWKEPVFLFVMLGNGTCFGISKGKMRC